MVNLYISSIVLILIVTLSSIAGIASLTIRLIFSHLMIVFKS